MRERQTDIITILGPTACGKTALATRLAKEIGAEIISADSRQIYRRMDIGTGKDLADYTLEDGEKIAYHLIDIAEPGYKYNLFEYQRDFLKAYSQIKSRGKRVIMCGGTGLYLEAVLRGYRLSPVPENKELRARLEGEPMDELVALLKTYKTLHNETDIDTAKRAIRAIEIADYYKSTPVDKEAFPALSSTTIGLELSRETRRERISQRLRARLQNGLVDEVRGLLKEGIEPEELIYYGLEYKYVTEYVVGRLSYEEMERQLEIAIHQFAKRQMTWFRGMQKRGTDIHWIDAERSEEEKARAALELINKQDDKGDGHPADRI